MLLVVYTIVAPLNSAVAAFPGVIMMTGALVAEKLLAKVMVAIMAFKPVGVVPGVSII